MSLYTDAEIAAFAAEQGCTVEEFRKRWVIVHGGACFVYGARGYRPAVKNQLDISLALKKHLAPVPPSSKSAAGIDWTYPIGAGEKDKTTDRFIVEYGSLATHYVLSTSIERSYYDATTETFYERVCPLRKLEPTYDEQVDSWLRLLGGSNAEALLDWVATCPDLSQPNCAVYLYASKDCGKTLFANGMSGLWGHAPSTMTSAVSSFNSTLLLNPLIFADEEFPRGVTSGFIREFVAALSRPLRRKNMPEATLLGAIRLVMAANNSEMLKFDREDFSPEDVDAVASRILYVKSNPQAADYLKSVGGFDATAQWLKESRIARHALWLHFNREVKKGSRFAIESESENGEIRSNIVTNGMMRERVVEWICKALLETWMEPNPGIRFGGGELYVNVSFVHQKWEQLLADKNAPSLKKIGQIFRLLSRGERRFKIGADGRRRADFYRIDVGHIYKNINALQLGTEEHFRALINRPIAMEDDGSPTGGAPPATDGAAGPSIPGGHTNGTNGTSGAHGAYNDRARLHSFNIFDPPRNEASLMNVISLFDSLEIKQ